MSAFCPDGCPDGEAGPCVVGHPCAWHPPVSADEQDATVLRSALAIPTATGDES